MEKIGKNRAVRNCKTGNQTEAYLEGAMEGKAFWEAENLRIFMELLRKGIGAPTPFLYSLYLHERLF